MTWFTIRKTVKKIEKWCFLEKYELLCSYAKKNSLATPFLFWQVEPESILHQRNKHNFIISKLMNWFFKFLTSCDLLLVFEWVLSGKWNSFGCKKKVGRSQPFCLISLGYILFGWYPLWIHWNSRGKIILE